MHIFGEIRTARGGRAAGPMWPWFERPMTKMLVVFTLRPEDENDPDMLRQTQHLSRDRRPGRFCFHFLSTCAHFVRGAFDSLDDGLAAANAVAMRDMCGCSCGPCRRDTKEAAHTDWYEPHEPNLEKTGLPHDHPVVVE